MALELAEGAICQTCGQSYHARNKVKSIGAIREKLIHDRRPLTDDECRFLFRIATGEEIERRKRCEECNATGKTLKATTAAQPCEACGGTGYLDT